jgi:uncharacterized protein DUF6009
MSSLLTEEELCHENNVVWLEDPDRLDYVRQSRDKTTRRRGKPAYAREGRIVGYAELTADAEQADSGYYQRRVFYLLPHDRDYAPEGVYREGAPGEAVDPRTIRPGKVGEKTPRSQYGEEAAGLAPS